MSGSCPGGRRFKSYPRYKNFIKMNVNHLISDTVVRIKNGFVGGTLSRKYVFFLDFSTFGCYFVKETCFFHDFFDFLLLLCQGNMFFLRFLKFLCLRRSKRGELL